MKDEMPGVYNILKYHTKNMLQAKIYNTFYDYYPREHRDGQLEYFKKVQQLAEDILEFLNLDYKLSGKEENNEINKRV